METRPPEKRLAVAPFTIHAARGLLRDPKMRRIMMAFTIAIAAILLVIGLSGLRSWLNPHEHPWRFVLFWLVCAWQTSFALLLAVFDLLMTRARARAERKAFIDRVANPTATSPPAEQDQS
jgi:hypothetical protein